LCAIWGRTKEAFYDPLDYDGRGLSVLHGWEEVGGGRFRTGGIDRKSCANKKEEAEARKLTRLPRQLNKERKQGAETLKKGEIRTFTPTYAISKSREELAGRLRRSAAGIPKGGKRLRSLIPLRRKPNLVSWPARKTERLGANSYVSLLSSVLVGGNIGSSTNGVSTWVLNDQLSYFLGEIKASRIA